MSTVSWFTATLFIRGPSSGLGAGESVRDEEAGDALLVAAGFLAGGTGFEGTVDRSVAGFATPVELKEELGRDTDAREVGIPERDMGRLVVVERAGPVDIFDEGDENG